MLHHRTQDPAARAASVADREAEAVWHRTGNYQLWLDAWQAVYYATLREFCST